MSACRHKSLHGKKYRQNIDYSSRIGSKVGIGQQSAANATGGLVHLSVRFAFFSVNKNRTSKRTVRDWILGQGKICLEQSFQASILQVEFAQFFNQGSAAKIQPLGGMGNHSVAFFQSSADQIAFHGIQIFF